MEIEDHQVFVIGVPINRFEASFQFYLSILL